MISPMTVSRPSANLYSSDTLTPKSPKIASWKLSEISHKEKSWLNSRKGLEPDQNGNEPLKLADIKEDSRKVRPYDHMWDMYYDEFEDAEVAQ